MRVDVGGKCAFDEAKRELCARGADCTPLMRRYFFYLAFENENCENYVTEKFSQLVALPIVPIVMKRSSYKK